MQVSQPVSPAVQQKTMLVKAKFGTREQFFEKMNPSIQRIAAKHPDRCHFGDAPTLAMLSKTYGESAASNWLMAQLTDLVAYTNSRGMLTDEHIEVLADTIAQEYWYLKASELLLFFYRFKLGRYGHFYGNIDPMKITIALDKFLGERSEAFDKQRKDEERREREEYAKHAVTAEEYCKQHGLPPMSSFIEVMNYCNRQDNETLNTKQSNINEERD